MKIFTRRNAVVGYFALKALRRTRRNATVGYLAAQGFEHARARRRGGRRALKITLYATLALVSLGILAGALGFWRRQSSTAVHAADAADALEPTVDAGAETVADTASEPDALDALEPASAT